jgi:hypothetical protein
MTRRASTVADFRNRRQPGVQNLTTEGHTIALDGNRAIRRDGMCTSHLAERPPHDPERSYLVADGTEIRAN